MLQPLLVHSLSGPTPVFPCAGCGKPEFFIKRKPLFEVDTKSGMLMNTDGGTPMVPIGAHTLW
jgi:hypothetical protein